MGQLSNREIKRTKLGAKCLACLQGQEQAFCSSFTGDFSSRLLSQSGSCSSGPLQCLPVTEKSW